MQYLSCPLFSDHPWQNSPQPTATRVRWFCKSLLCSMFNEQTCSRLTRLFVRLFKNKLFGCFHLFRILHVLHVLRTYSTCSHPGSGTASSNINSIDRVPFSPIPLAFDPEHCCCCSWTTLTCSICTTVIHNSHTNFWPSSQIAKVLHISLNSSCPILPWCDIQQQALWHPFWSTGTVACASSLFLVREHTR